MGDRRSGVGLRGIGLALVLWVAGCMGVAAAAVPTPPTYTDTGAYDSFSSTVGTLTGGTTYGIKGVTPAGSTATAIGALGLLVLDTASGSFTYTPDRTAMNRPATATTDPFVFIIDGAETAYSVSLTAVPEQITVRPDEVRKAYRADDPALTYTVSSGTLLPGDTLTGHLVRGDGEDAGIYFYGLGTLSGGSTYDITLNASGRYFWIDRRPITVTPDALTRYYGDPNPTLTYTVTSGTIEPGDSLIGSLSVGANQGSPPATYPISIGSLTGANYTLTLAQRVLTIAPRPLTVTGATVATRPYDGTRTATIAGATLAGVIGGDTVVLDGATTGQFAQVDAGVDLAVATSMTISGSEAGRYILTQPALRGTIAGSTRTLIIDPASFNADGYRLDAAPPTLTATASAGAGAITWSSSTPDVCLVGATTGVITLVAPGTCTIGAAIAAHQTFYTAEAAPISFAVRAAAAPAPAVRAALSTVRGASVTAAGDGTAPVRVACRAAAAGGCTATVTLVVDGRTVSTRNARVASGAVRTVALTLPASLQNRLARAGRLVVTVVVDGADAAGGSERSTREIALIAPTADGVGDLEIRRRANGDVVITGTCEGSRVARCEGTLTVLSGRVVVARAALAAQGGRAIRAIARLNPTGRDLLRARGELAVRYVVAFRGIETPTRIPVVDGR